jgi:hypothetical protein
MSTRAACVVTVVEGNEHFSVYRHCDGYPEGDHGVMATLAKALPYAWPLPRFEARDFAAAIIAAWKQPGGGNVYCTTKAEHHGDLAYIYTVSLKDRDLWVSITTPKYKRTESRVLFEGRLQDYPQPVVEEVNG